MPRTTSARTKIRKLMSDYTDRILALATPAKLARTGDGDLIARVMSALDRLGGRTAGSRGRARRPARASAPRPRRRRLQSAAQRRANVLQGRYMGTIRLLSGPAKNRVRAVREKSGVAAAITFARQLRKS